MGKILNFLFLYGNAGMLLAFIYIKSKEHAVKSQEIYKTSSVYEEAINILRSHKGVAHYMGDSIEDGKVVVLDQKKEDDLTTYHVKVPVSGEKDNGNMHFWIQRRDDQDALLKRIELQLRKTNGTLLICDRTKTLPKKEEKVEKAQS